MEKTTKTPQRPITMRVNDLKNDLNLAVRKSGLPPFMLELILGEFLSGISMVAQREYAQDLEEWKKSQKEVEENGK